MADKVKVKLLKSHTPKGALRPVPKGAVIEVSMGEYFKNQVIFETVTDAAHNTGSSKGGHKHTAK